MKNHPADRKGPVSRISVIEASYLQLEEPGGPALAIGAALLVGGKCPTVDQVCGLIESRRDQAERLFTRLEESSVPRLNRPKWVPADVVLTNHVHEVTVGEDPNGFDGLVASIMEKPMDRSRPLWDLHLVPDAAEGHWGLVWRNHHAVTDGQGTSMLMGRFLDTEPAGGTSLTDYLLAQAHAALDDRDTTDAPIDDRSDLKNELDQAWKTVRSLAERVPDTARSVAGFVPSKASGLAGDVTSGRSWVSLNADLSAVKAAGKQYGATVNDVILAAVAYGFTRLLTKQGVDPVDRVARCMMPVSMRDPRDPTPNNQASILPIGLPLGITEPAALIQAVGEQTSVGKHSLTPLLADSLADLASRVVPYGLQQAVSAEPSDSLLQFAGDTCITNVPGPQIPLYVLGQPIAAQYPILPIGKPMRYGVAITSLNGNLHLCVSSDDHDWNDTELLALSIQAFLNGNAATS